MPRVVKPKPAPPPARRGPGRPTVLPSPWLELAEAAGGVVALAEALETTRESVRRWALGLRVPELHARRAHNAWAKRRGLVEPWPT